MTCLGVRPTHTSRSVAIDALPLGTENEDTSKSLTSVINANNFHRGNSRRNGRRYPSSPFSADVTTHADMLCVQCRRLDSNSQISHAVAQVSVSKYLCGIHVVITHLTLDAPPVRLQNNRNALQSNTKCDAYYISLDGNVASGRDASISV
jgi:hypothetical protein